MKKTSVEKKETGYMFIVVCLLAFLVTLVLSFMNYIFILACMLMLSLLLFSICYRIKDNNEKKMIMYILYVIGVLLILGVVGVLLFIGIRQ